VVGAAFVALGVAGAGAFGCAVNLSGLTGGAADGSTDATKDGGGDHSNRGGDGAEDRATRDSGGDGGPREACVVIETDGGATAACPPTDASCAPQSTAAFTPVFVPPRAPLSVCTSEQITTYTQNCFEGGDASTCGQFQSDSTNAPCIQCMVSADDTSETEWGPILQGAGYLFLNIGGCVALKEPCQTKCAASFEAYVQCQTYSCASVCPVTDEMSAEAFAECAVQTEKCSCLPEQRAYEACQAELVGTSAAVCFPVDSFVMAATTLAGIFCGGT
jgi:hypothetical protein